MVADEIERLMGSLEATDQEVLSRRLNGEDQATIAQALQCSERTVRRSLQRIRQHFQPLQTQPTS